ncbi:MAG TPA: glycosyltransferase [Flavobacterium sp.]|jgi:glycosyltransferase involved in cell wall biosynthesis
MQKIAIIIPCYNESERLKESFIEDLINFTLVDIFLVNDGSKDNTLSIINGFSERYSDRCFVIHYETNEGKASAIFKSSNQIISDFQYDIVGYFDADFSTPVEETKILIHEMLTGKNEFILGSRIMLLNSEIKRKTYRHIIGRIIITIIDLRFKLGIYDTQCGAKLFSADIIRQVFNKPFKTSWLFDIEIFLRLKKINLLKKGREIPIYNWKDIEGSKLEMKTCFKIVKELYLLFKTYK